LSTKIMNRSKPCICLPLFTLQMILIDDNSDG